MRTISITGSVKIDASDLRTYAVLRQNLELVGFQTTSEQKSNYLLSINHNKESYKRFIQGGGRRDQAILIRLEPEAVFPLQYRSAITDCYGLVITPGSTFDRESSKSFVGWPYEYNLNPARPDTSDPSLHSILTDNSRQELFNYEFWKLRPKKIALVAANKVSPLKDANYKIRRKLANELSAEILEVYGSLWSDALFKKIYHRLAVAGTNLRQGVLPNAISIYGSLFQTYPAARGIVHNKHALLRETKFSLVIENSNSYVSEKLIDALINGSIPIYVGPPLEKVGLPSQIAIHSCGDPKEVLTIIETLGAIEVETILTAMREFLNSPTFFDFWTGKSVYKRLAQQIAEYVQGVPE